MQATQANFVGSFDTRYMVFRGEDDLVKGGWSDYVGAEGNLQAAIRMAVTQPNTDGESPLTGQGEWYHIVDMVEQRVVIEGMFYYTTVTVDGWEDGDIDDIPVLESVTCDVVGVD